MALPLVSILIPSYKVKHFEFMLKSAVGQSYENIEIVISDDCQSDDIANIVNRYSSLVPIRYQKNPNPDGLGFSNCVNCMRMARGEYIKFLFDDDVLMPFCIQYMVDAFENNKSINPRLVVSERWFIDSDGHYVGVNRLPGEGVVDVTEYSVGRYMALSLTNRVGEFTTAMWRRVDCFDEEGEPLFSNLNGRKVDWLVDVAMWINLARRGRVLYVALPLSCFRQHIDANSSSKERADYYKIFTDWEVVVDQALDVGDITAAEAWRSYKRLANQYKDNEKYAPSLCGHAERLSKKMKEVSAWRSLVYFMVKKVRGRN